MAASFVPVPIPVEGCRSWHKRTPPKSCGPPSPRGVAWMRGVGSRGVPEGCPSGHGGAAVEALSSSSSSVLEEGSVSDSWMERPNTPTLLGHEIMEERSKFTVYKILVTGSQGNSWVIFRRYADFCRLNDKLKELFPRFRLALPPKRWFKDNYDMEFLEERQIGLQTFLQNLIAHKDIINSEVVRQFLCLDNPPSPFDSLVESRAFCETLEETNHRLQKELLDKQREIDRLTKTLEEREDHIALLVKQAKDMSHCPQLPESPSALEDGHRVTDTSTHTEGDTDVTGHGQIPTDENEEDAGRQYSISVTEQELNPATSSSCEAAAPVKSHGAYWTTLVISDSPAPS
ncbi:sorting nexin-16 [Myripristis murdjan]|uniref:Sorting nexin-16 n=1 Tax=Myripristis murdjan TaxID=586833 RepID=A0A667YYW5_9TELE|nr:sorting nexin-16-like [Myripristis murdjan]